MSFTICVFLMEEEAAELSDKVVFAKLHKANLSQNHLSSPHLYAETVVKNSIICSTRIYIYWQKVTESTTSNIQGPEQRPKQRNERLELETNEYVPQRHIYEIRARIRPTDKWMTRNGNKNSSIGQHKTIPPTDDVLCLVYQQAGIDNQDWMEVLSFTLAWCIAPWASSGNASWTWPNCFLSLTYETFY